MVYYMIGNRTTLYILLAGAILAAIAIGLLAYNAQPETYNETKNGVATITSSSETKSPVTTSIELTGSWHGRYNSKSGTGEWMFTLTKKDENYYVGELMTNGPYSTQGEKIPVMVHMIGETILIYIPALDMNITGKIVNGELQGTWRFSNGADQGEWRGVRGAIAITDTETTTIIITTSQETKTTEANPYDSAKEINPPSQEPYNKIINDIKKVLSEIFGGAKLTHVVSSNAGRMYVEYIVKIEITPGKYSVEKIGSILTEMGYTVATKADTNDEFVIVFTYTYEGKITYITAAGKAGHQTVSLLINYT